MLAESQVSGLFLRLFWLLPDERHYRHEPQILRFFKKIVPCKRVVFTMLYAEKH